jgi:hypothetical protein
MTTNTSAREGAPSSFLHHRIHVIFFIVEIVIVVRRKVVMLRFKGLERQPLSKMRTIGLKSQTSNHTNEHENGPDPSISI